MLGLGWEAFSVLAAKAVANDTVGIGGEEVVGML